ncbi:helix-turn-helix domain-containing protein [Halocatena pleomorpha]|uniref:ArsR family transcriptional regulator n=1 Tax=Halocatena pleomorpha TaxID=1785090 RepID=A0A3P3RFX8_9EURY|nr:helix-turn-helix domain-containing protein [Halocatena pleomorpha]RRJ31818.1 ArsR family transcriptional regulator [Halocatena pleomorpha]
MDSNTKGIENNPTNPIQTVEHALAIVEAVEQSNGARVSELDTRLDLTKSTIYNHLAALQHNGYGVKQGDTYHVGLQWLRFGGHARDRRHLYRTAKQTVDTVAKQT